MTRISRFTFRAWLLAFLWLAMAGAHAAIDRTVLAPLGSDDPDARIEAVGHIAALATPDARRVLDALNNETLYVTPAGDVLVVDDDQAWNPVTDATTTIPDDAEDISVNNRLRSVLQGALSGMRLFSEDRGERLAAARAMTRNADPAQLPLIDKALEKENDAEVIAQLEQVRAIANLTADEAAKRKAALITLRNTTDASLMGTFRDMAEKKPDGSYREPNAEVRAEAIKTVAALQNHLRMTDIAGKVFYGLSLGSVLLLAALGLAITFGLMGIINMAHGEMLMIGAYTTYLCQLFFRAYFPEAIDAYLLLALPAAFIVTAAVGIVIERLVIRWLYGRPLETLLCTWGISLMLMQAVRTIFGAQNVEVANPSWMSGGITVMGSLALSWNRIIIIVFSLLVVLAVWLILNKTRLGLFLRAVTQNRRMADCVGVSTGRIDMMTFGLGCGIAGLGGVALSQLGNVGPDLGQAYIVDSFMVVVLGGVGQLAGTVIAAFGLGEITKFLEPVAGAVLAKIAILVVIIVFIQKRPQGLFALKGRSVE